MQAIVFVAELTRGQRRGEIAAVFERHRDIRQAVVVHVDAAGVIAADTGDHPGVLAAGIALRFGAIGVERQGQVFGGFPLGIPAELRGVHHAVLGDGGNLGNQLGHRHAGDPVIANADVAPAMEACVFVEDRVLDVVRLVIAHGRCVETREQRVDARAESLARLPLPHARDAGALLLLDARAEARAAQAQQVGLVGGDRAVLIRVELARANPA